MKSDVLKQLLKAHVDGDDTGFRKAALQLAAAESSAGHVRTAEGIREIIAQLRPPLPQQSRGMVVDLAQPRGELAELLEGSFRTERLGDIVLPPKKRDLLTRLILESRSRVSLQKWSVAPRRKLLFHGPPGCGKTLAAAVMAGELGVPLMTVRFDALFSRFLGATANHLRLIFGEMPRKPGVYLFDEFDAVAKKRADVQDVGEMRRIVSSFLQLVDADKSASLLIAATNHVELLDRAVFRRFDAAIQFELPGADELLSLLRLRLGAFRLGARLLRDLARTHVGISYADATKACEDAIRTMALEQREALTQNDLIQAFDHLRTAKEPEAARS